MVASAEARQLGNDVAALEILAKHIEQQVQGDAVELDSTRSSAQGGPLRRPGKNYVLKPEAQEPLRSAYADLLSADTPQEQAVKEAYYWRC
jgi:hypothetical protein